jgi:hypothetical protein
MLCLARQGDDQNLEGFHSLLCATKRLSHWHDFNCLIHLFEMLSLKCYAHEGSDFCVIKSMVG